MDNRAVLIVDDNEQFAKVLKRTLEGGFGFSAVSWVDEVEKGFSEIASNPDKYELLFIDFRFPSGRTGGELLEMLAAANLIEGKVAFLITSEPTPENLAQAVAAGALGVLAKPFDKEDLKRHLDKAQRFFEMKEVESF